MLNQPWKSVLVVAGLLVGASLPQTGFAKSCGATERWFVKVGTDPDANLVQLDQIVQTTAFFTRTTAPTFDPFGDNWWQQHYNAKLLFRYIWMEKIGDLVPAKIQRGLSRSICSANRRKG